MIKIINIDNAEKSEILTRDIKLESGVESIVADIIKNVRENGDKALKEYSAAQGNQNTGLTEDQVKAIVEKALQGQLTTAHLEAGGTDQRSGIRLCAYRNTNITAGYRQTGCCQHGPVCFQRTVTGKDHAGFPVCIDGILRCRIGNRIFTHQVNGQREVIDQSQAGNTLPDTDIALHRCYPVDLVVCMSSQVIVIQMNGQLMLKQLVLKKDIKFKSVLNVMKY